MLVIWLALLNHSMVAIKKLILHFMGYFGAPCLNLAVSSPPSTISAWFQSYSVGLTGIYLILINTCFVHERLYSDQIC